MSKELTNNSIEIRFLAKSSKIMCCFDYTILFKLLVCDTILKEFMEKLPMSALTTVAGKSLHILFDKYLDMLVKIEQNRMVRTIQIFEVFDQKRLTIFYKVLTPFWKTFLWLKQLFDAKLINSKTIIFKCSENYGRPSPTRVTRLNVAPNMADPISLNEKDHSLNKWLCFPTPTTLWFSETVYKR